MHGALGFQQGSKRFGAPSQKRWKQDVSNDSVIIGAGKITRVLLQVQPAVW